jgi:hypothetical protein
MCGFCGVFNQIIREGFPNAPQIVGATQEEIFNIGGLETFEEGHVPEEDAKYLRFPSPSGAQFA